MVTAADARQVRDIYAPFCTETTVSFEEAAPAVDEMERRIRAVTATYPWLLAVDFEGLVNEGGPQLDRAQSGGGIVAGYVYASRHRERAAYRWSVEVTAYLHAAYRRLGIGTVLYRALFAILASQGFHRAYAGITLPNPASVGLHESLGFQQIALYREVGFKSGAWRDVSWWELPIGEPTSAEPSDPRPVNELIVLPGASHAASIPAEGSVLGNIFLRAEAELRQRHPRQQDPDR